MTETRESTIRREPTADGAWRAFEPAADAAVVGRGQTETEAVINYCIAMQRGDALVATHRVRASGEGAADD
jgi:hypothetical protein